jgi:xylan 1,4-beta-xylosidase
VDVESLTRIAIRNPVLRGFHPDPSIVRVGGDYYLATSSFEWWPGVPLHHSTDLVNWRPIGHILTHPSQADLRGVPDSAGVWAPSLSYHDGLFWLVYTVNRTVGTDFKDAPNYLITAPDILGPWSEPVPLNATGFDPSLFHDADGRKWLAQIQWDFRPGHNSFAGIVLREYDHERRTLVGEQQTILRSDDLIEGPNLYRHGDWYHLLLAEGGTGWNHGIGTARSRTILGPYERDPHGPVLTSRDDEGLALQKAGHGELVCTPDGEWFLAHLASRPVTTAAGRFCILGRETCLQRVDWPVDGWLRLAGGGTAPQVEVAGPSVCGEPAALPAEPAVSPDGLARGLAPGLGRGLARDGSREHDDFDAPRLEPAWSSLRVPVDTSWLSLTERPGWLRLRGRDSPHSLFEQSLVAKRLPSVDCTATTRLQFRPTHFTQLAGLICWYDTSTHYYLRVTHDEAYGRVAGVVLSDEGAFAELREHEIQLDDAGDVWLRATFACDKLSFSVSQDGERWQPVGPALDATRLSDDYGSVLRFTGAMVGLCAQDLNGAGSTADFDHFTLQPAGAQC